MPRKKKQTTDANLKEVGVQKVVREQEAPVQVGTDGDTKLIEMQTRITSSNVLQPFLTEEEVKKVGLLKWHKWRDGSSFTVVVNYRRLLLDHNTFMRLKDKGLVTLDG